ncbi:MAG: hypothetical protein O2866_04105 [archaeon]|nr:hypothetical protein [archaeon]MDA1168047.1 hypothetical protein [archaeon]
MQEIPSDAGIQDVHVFENSIYIVDLFGRIYTLENDESQWALRPIFHELEIANIFASPQSLFIVTTDGSVQQIRDGITVWIRPLRGDFGEHILNISETETGTIIICREGHAYVDGEEEVLEIEWWKDKKCMHRHDIKHSVVSSLVVGGQIYLGCSDGVLIKADEHGTWDILVEKQYPIQNIIQFKGQIIFSWWFYLSGFDQEKEWIVEHKGIVQLLSVDSKRERMYFAGSDQNEFTDVEPIGMVDLSKPIVEIDKSELTTWFEQEEALHVEESIYESDDEMIQLLSEEEQKLYRNFDSKGNVDALLHAMNEDSSFSSFELEDGGYEDILVDLLLDSTTIRPPIPRAGEDLVIQATEGSAIVHLDASGTEDDDEQIDSISWIDHLGNTIAESYQCKVKLPIGTYRFEFRIRDKNGMWSTDSISIQIIE